MKVLMISTDETLFQSESDSRKRIKLYGTLMKELHIIVVTSARDVYKDETISDNVFIYGTHSGSKLKTFFILLRSGKKRIKKHNLDLVIAQDPYKTGFAGWLLTLGKNVKLLVGVYGTNVFDKEWIRERFTHRVYKVVGQFIFSRADAIQTDGREAYDDLQARYGKKVFWKPMIRRIL